MSYITTLNIYKRRCRDNHLFENRQEGDYVDFVSFDKDTVEPYIPRVIDFINIITQLIEDASHTSPEK